MIQTIFAVVVAGVIIYMLIKLFPRVLRWLTGGQQGAQAQNQRPSAIALIVVAVLVFLELVLLLNPSVFEFGFSPIRDKEAARAAVVKYGLDPRDNPSQWSSDPAKAAAKALEAEYQRKAAEETAKLAVIEATSKRKAAEELAKMSAIEADRLCHLPKGHPDRELFDKAGEDPCKKSLPARVQAGNGEIGPIDVSVGPIDLSSLSGLGKTFSEMERSLAQPLGNPPEGADNWIRQLYLLPKGVLLFAAVLLLLSFVVRARRPART